MSIADKSFSGSLICASALSVEDEDGLSPLSTDMISACRCLCFTARLQFPINSDMGDDKKKKKKKKKAEYSNLKRTTFAKYLYRKNLFCRRPEILDNSLIITSSKHKDWVFIYLFMSSLVRLLLLLKQITNIHPKW